MKSFLASIAIFAVCVPFCLGTEFDAQTALILKSPAFSKDEMKEVLFSASFPGNYSAAVLAYALYNPSRDRDITGIVVNLHNKNTTSGEEQSVDFFIKVDCGPLQCVSNQEGCSIFSTIAKGSPVITLKEVHYFIPEEVKAAAASKTDQARPAFVHLQLNGTMEVDNTPVQSAELPAKLKELAGEHEKRQVIVKADKDVPYGRVVEVLDACRAAGISNVVFGSTTTPNTDK